MSNNLANDLLSEFTQNNLDWLRRTTINRSPMSSEEWLHISFACTTLATTIKEVSDRICKSIDLGIEEGELKEGLERGLALIASSLEIMDELKTSGEKEPAAFAALNGIRNVIAKMKAIRDHLASLLVLAETEGDPVPDGILGAAEAGPFIRLDEFKKRR